MSHTHYPKRCLENWQLALTALVSCITAARRIRCLSWRKSSVLSRGGWQKRSGKYLSPHTQINNPVLNICRIESLCEVASGGRCGFLSGGSGAGDVPTAVFKWYCTSVGLDTDLSWQCRMVSKGELWFFSPGLGRGSPSDLWCLVSVATR